MYWHCRKSFHNLTQGIRNKRYFLQQTSVKIAGMALVLVVRSDPINAVRSMTLRECVAMEANNISVNGCASSNPILKLNTIACLVVLRD